MGAPKDTLLLFDIDGTLITSGGAGEHAMGLAVQDLYGSDSGLEGIEIAGRTDGWIASQLVERHGAGSSAEAITTFLDAYLRRLSEELPKRNGTLLPGILPLLEALGDKPNVALALLTGNVSRGAELKLTHYGVWTYFDFGAYADDAHDRNFLGPIAQSRAEEYHGNPFAPERTYVIGDTPHDVACGQAFGARTVAVATGKYSRSELAQHNPDILLDDLADVPGVMAALGLG